MGSLATSASNRAEVDYNRRFSTNISLYLRDGARRGHGYSRTLIGTRIRSTGLYPVTLSDTKLSQTTALSTFCIAFRIFVVTGVRDWLHIWYSGSSYQVLSRRCHITPKRGVVMSHEPLKFWSTTAVFLERLKLELSNPVHRQATSSPIAWWSGSRDLF